MQSIFRSIFYMPGVFIHELSHHFFCIIFGVKVFKFCYYNFKDSSGYVLHEQANHLYQNVLISTAPFFLNSLLGALISYSVIVNKLSTLGLFSLNCQDIFKIIISISIGMKAIPSKGDGLSIWNCIGDSDINFLFKLLAQVIVIPLLLIIFLISFSSSFLKIDLLYGICVCFLGPKLIEFTIYLDIVQEFIKSIQNFNL